MPPILELDRISFSFDTKRSILSDVSFSLNGGEFSVLGGRNGTGKSILLRCIKGLLQPSGGSVKIYGRDLTKNARARNLSIGLVFQDADTQMVGQTVERDILFGLDNLGITGDQRKRRFDEVVSLMGLEPVLHQRPRTLSGGEKRRLAIAGVLVMAPHVLMLDEPFANLDFPGIVGVLEALVSLKEQGTTILVATHEIEKLLAHADCFLLLDGGTVAAQGDPVEVLEVVEQHGLRRPRFHDATIPLEQLTWLR